MMAGTVRELLTRAQGGKGALSKYYSENFGAFVRAAWRYALKPDEGLVWCWAYDLWCEHLVAVTQGKELRLIGNTPPRFLKSTITNVCWPCWTWTTQPHHSFLCASYSMDLSTEHSISRRNLITSEWFQSLWGDRFRLSNDRNLTTEFTNNRHGAMVATAVGARTLGKGASMAIIGDDLMSADMALSDAERKSANAWVDQTLLTRLNNPATGAIVLIAQRLHEMDTTGYMLETQPGRWCHVKLPLVADEDETWIFPISRKVVERKQGQVLQPERFTASTVEEISARRYVFAGQYQQRPAPVEGNLIRRSDIQYFGGTNPVTGVRDESPPERFEQKVISVDCAFKDLSTSDYVAILVIGVKGRKRYVLDVVNKHLDLDATEAEIRRRLDLHGRISAVLIEGKANGSAVVKRLKANVPGVIEINPEGGKLSRAFATAPEFQARDWFVDRSAAWCEPFIEQLAMFPACKNDDMLDATSQAAIWLQSACEGFFEFIKQEAAKAEAMRNHPRLPDRASDVELELSRAQKGLLLPVDRTAKPPARSTMNEKQTTKCPSCGAILARYSEGRWKCNPCGQTGQDR